MDIEVLYQLQYVFLISSLENPSISHKIEIAIDIVSKLLSIIIPTNDNLNCYKNAKDLIELNQFPDLPDKNLHIIFDIHEAKLTNYSIIWNPKNQFEPFNDKCLLGWSDFGPEKT